MVKHELVAKETIDDTVDEDMDLQFKPFYKAGIDNNIDWQTIFLSSDDVNYDKTDGPP